MSDGGTSRSELLTELRRLADRLGRTPSMTDAAERGEFSPSTYQSRFGSWNDAVIEAGLHPNSVDDCRYSETELVAELRTVADELGKTPTKADMREHGAYSPTTYVDRFGGWRDALAEADLSTDSRGTKIPRRELLAELETMAESLGRPPTSTEMDEDGVFSASTYFRRFDTWAAAVDAADLDGTPGPGRPKISEQELLDEISRMADVLHRPPTTTEMDELGEYSLSTYLRRFGSWETALEEAGVGPTDRRQRPSNRIREETLLADLRALAADLGRPPTAEEMWKRGAHSPATYLDRYDTWNGALEAADLQPRRFRKAGIRDRELVRSLRELAASLERRPQRQEMDTYGLISGTTYFNRFGSWRNALDAAGLTARPDDDRVIVEGLCTVCCDSVATPVSDLAADGRPYCTSECEAVYADETIDFADDVLARGDDEELIGRFAALLYSLETYVPDVLLYLRYSLTMARAGFSSATSDGYRLFNVDCTVEVVSRTGGVRFRVADDVLDDIGNRIERVSGQTDSVLAATGVGDAADVRSEL